MKKISKRLFLKQVKESILAIDPEAEVYLFGSRARGDYRRNSDWDFLVLTDKTLDQKLEYAIWDTFTELELASEQIINPIVHEKREWVKRPASPLYGNISLDGRPI
ncbi:nucleotidyltransferase domain-containing protein [Arsenicibacter rosenii]|uniref:Polymerase nucleotidyl transferase domain-containing protein n=1 Tax=Arsenicibacter rosenii TaxID=1750698 RepID=A0A1S2VRL6_9BACT|nr:nucleotidyltransferase domain-containing protein [Arsenicibacter rosenii]OIN60528.1 hypothetical protein BLX24_05610 [Arsenicibacter rosenii]